MAESKYSMVEEASIKNGDKKRTSPYIAILLAAAAPCILVSSITGLLIGLIIAHRVNINPGLPELQGASGPGNTSDAGGSFWKSGGSGAYYIQFNPSTLTILASWTGKLIPYLSSVTMGLIAFFVADAIRKTSLEGQNDKLLTPKQLVLLLNLLSNTFEGWWGTLSYRTKKGNKLKGPLPFALTSLVLTTIIGFAIVAADTWFGIVVVPIQRTQIQVASPPQHVFSRGINDTCIGSYPKSFCNVFEEISLTYSPDIVSEAFATLANTSTTHVVKQFPSTEQPPIFYLGSVAASSNVDFKASTFSVSTQCQPITKQCLPPKTTLINVPDIFNCSTGFTGNISAFTGPSGASGLGLDFFEDPGLITPMPSPPQDQTPPGQNPLYFGIWALNQQSQTLMPDTDSDDGLIVLSSTGTSESWFLNCSATIYDTTYTWVNGSVADVNNTLSNNTMGIVISAPFTHTLGMQALQLGATMACYENSSVTVASTTAAYFSRAVLSLAIGVFTNRTNLLEQSRSEILLTRVPLVPFYTLLGLKFFYALSAILLAVATIIWANPTKSVEVKDQLSIEGLATEIFGPDVFKDKSSGGPQEVTGQGAVVEEEKKVGVVQVEGGRWVYAMTMP